MRPPPAHRATTAHLQAVYPFVAEGGPGDRGVYIGRDLFGGAFTYDAWELYAVGVLTNPEALAALSGTFIAASVKAATTAIRRPTSLALIPLCPLPFVISRQNRGAESDE